VLRGKSNASLLGLSELVSGEAPLEKCICGLRNQPACAPAGRVPAEPTATARPSPERAAQAERVIDLHCHLLPGIDDGPATLDEALAMARLAVANGISEARVTPHVHVGRWDNDLAGIEKAVGEHRAQLALAGIPLKLGFAAEVRLAYEVLPLIEAGRVPYLGELDGYKIMLLELPHSHVPVGSDKFVTWLLNRGIRPMIAHPERNREIMRDSSRLRPFVLAGCLLQLTADAVAGAFGEVCETPRDRVSRERMGDGAGL